MKVGSEAGVVSETGAGANAYVLQRSKSSGGGTISLQKTSNSANPTDKAAKSVDPLPDLTHFPEHTQNLLRKIATGSIAHSIRTTIKCQSILNKKIAVFFSNKLKLVRSGWSSQSIGDGSCWENFQSFN